MKQYVLQHYHKGAYWGVGIRTEEQINALINMAQDIVRTQHTISFKLKDMFSEPLFMAIEMK